MSAPQSAALTAAPGRDRAIAMTRWRLLALLGALSMFAPLCTDMYLPALPAMAHSLHASAAALNLTLTASMIGLGCGQLISGPLSDAYGRRRPVLAGLVVYTASSVGCALCNDVWTLSAVRLLQGAAGAAGIVVGRAIVRDLFEGVEAARLFSRLMIVIGLAPILAPVIGGQLLHVTDWRGIFIALAAGGALLLAVCVRGLPETLPVALRHHGGGAASMRVMSGLLRDRRFAGLTVIQGLFFAALFSYIAGSSFALENVFGVSPQLFGVIFGVNALGLVGSSQVGARYVGRVGPRRLATIGLCGAAVTGVVLIVAILAHAGLWIVLPCFFSLMVNYGLVGPNLTALAMASHPRSAGGASALIGSIQFSAGAAVAPVVGLAGTRSAVPMGVLIAGSVLVSLGVWRRWEARG